MTLDRLLEVKELWRNQGHPEADGTTSQGSDFNVHKQETAGFTLTHSGWSGGGLGITSSTTGCTHRNKNES